MTGVPPPPPPHTHTHNFYLLRKRLKIYQKYQIKNLPNTNSTKKKVFVYSEWGLKKSDVVALFSLLATTGTFANVAAALGAVKLFGGLRGFNAAATLRFHKRVGWLIGWLVACLIG